MTAKPVVKLVPEQVKKLGLTWMLQLHQGRVNDLDLKLAAERARAAGTAGGKSSAPATCGRGVTKPTRMRSPKPQ